jgi:hypothetical protein
MQRSLAQPGSGADPGITSCMVAPPAAAAAAPALPTMGCCCVSCRCAVAVLVVLVAVGVRLLLGSCDDGDEERASSPAVTSWQSFGDATNRTARGTSPLETLWVGGDGKPGGGATHARCLFVVVPGAPGLGVLYERLLQELLQALDDRSSSSPEPLLGPCAAVALSYPRDPSVPSELERVVEHVTAALESLLEQQQQQQQQQQQVAAGGGAGSMPGRVVVLAQSMGAWFTLRALAEIRQRRPELLLGSSGGGGVGSSGPVLRGVQLITPFLDPAASARGRSARWLLPKLAVVARGCERCLPALLTPRQLGRLIMGVQWLRGKGPSVAAPPAINSGGTDYQGQGYEHGRRFYEAIAARLGEGVATRTLALAQEAIVGRPRRRRQAAGGDGGGGALGPLHTVDTPHPRERAMLVRDNRFP